MRTTTRLAGAAVLALACLPAAAVTGFSRACRFSALYTPAQRFLVSFIYLTGSAPWGKFDNLLNAPVTTQANYCVLESITTNYADTRYYLYAENKVYRYYDARGQFVLQIGYKSPGFITATLPDAVLRNQELFPYFANRGYGTFANARAGDPEILRYWSPNPKSATLPTDDFEVEGQHAYFDAVSGQTMNAGYSFARDCNLGEWGLEWR